MEYRNFMKLARFNGDEKYHFTLGTIHLNDADHGVFMTFKVETTKCLRSLSDTRSIKALPRYSITLPMTGWAELKKGAKFQLKRSYDKESDSHQATLYYSELQDVENNKIEVIDSQNDKYLLKLTGATMDVNFSDGTKSATEIEIFGYFKKSEV